MKKLILLISQFVLLTIVFFSCGKGELESRSMAQIYAEEGIPVKVTTVEPQLFEVELSYNGILTGIEESSAFAKVDAKVEKIYVKVGDYVQKNDILLTIPDDNPNAQFNQAKIAYENAVRIFNLK